MFMRVKICTSLYINNIYHPSSPNNKFLIMPLHSPRHILFIILNFIIILFPKII